MGIYTGGKSTAINSPRHLALRHARRTVVTTKRESGFRLTAAEDELPEITLLPGQEKLNSYWAPGLDAGITHTVKVSQTVLTPDESESLEIKAEQVFSVEAPQFVLDKGAVHSIYPPAGYADDARILPHVVLTDPHLPWARLGSPSTDEKDEGRNRVPWLALVTFAQDELLLTDDELNGLGGMFSDSAITRPEDKLIKQSGTMSVKMPVGEFLKVNNMHTPISATGLDDVAKSTVADFVFIKNELFTSLFSNYDDDNHMIVPEKPNTQPYKYMAHVRTINTKGMAVAGVEDQGIFSIVIGNRSGPLSLEAPTSVSVHLISIEDVEDNMKFPLDPAKGGHVALCSLHSWTYTVQPAGMMNVYEAFTHLGSTLNVLRPPQEKVDELAQMAKESQSSADDRLAKRVRDGYSLVKYRVHTGDATVALFRGPLTPTLVPKHSELGNCSNSGIDLQILDRELGIMDITYSAAWQLGRTLALGDQVFTAALGRVRTAVHARAMKLCKIQAIKDLSASRFRTTADVLIGLRRLTANLASVQLGNTPESTEPTQPAGDKFGPGGPFKRWHRRRLRHNEVPNLGYLSKIIVEKYADYASQAAEELAMSVDGETLYDETNIPMSSDWMILLSWVMDRMFLAGVPAHYLITDPSHVPQESLRFFHIDENWIDALVDGALSLANHMGEDRDRVAIKQALNKYIRSKPELQPHAPQIPTYGFFLRSDLVSMFPDLRVTTQQKSKEVPKRAPLLRHNIMADGVMLGMFDRIPGTGDFTSLILTQPPHQQRFSVARDLEADKISLAIRKQYTVAQDIREQDDDRHDPFDNEHTTGLDLPTGPSSKKNAFIWGSEPGKLNLRLLRPDRFAQLQLDVLRAHMDSFGPADHRQKYFEDDTPTSALLAMQLNDDVFNLTIDLEDHPVLKALRSPPPPPPDEPNAPMAFRVMAMNEVRVLTSLTAVAVPGMHPDNESDDEGGGELSGDEDDDDLVSIASFSRPAGAPLTLSSQRNLAPNIRAFSTAPLPSLSPASPQAQTQAVAPPPSPPAGARVIPKSQETAPGNVSRPPKFTCSVYSVGQKMVVTHPGLANLDQDLVFSISMSQNSHSSYQLREFSLLIPLGRANDPGQNYLLADYDGPGAAMLSNLRFNVLVSFPDQQGVKYMMLRLLPRSSKGWIYVRDVREVSFILSLARVNAFKPHRITGALRQLEVQTYAYYENAAVVSPLKDSFRVTINNLTAS
ncbi:hypothetical protein MN608_10960 [Microdochium nivale]|nr:hypothetical protein MN608_10960 [Microdochium nivale]